LKPSDDSAIPKRKSGVKLCSFTFLAKSGQREGTKAFLEPKVFIFSQVQEIRAYLFFNTGFQLSILYFNDF